MSLTPLSARLLGPADYRSMPWKNGRGVTTELAIHPAEAGLNGAPFDWRMSMADVTEDGEFSRFPGYDRSLVVAQGAGMELDFDNASAPLRLAGPGQMACFSGDWLTRGRLLDGPVRDFNVMSARTRIHHECEVIAGGIVEFVWEPAVEDLFCYGVAGTLVLKMRGSAEWNLEPQQSLWLAAAPGRAGYSQLMVMPHSRNTLAIVVRLRRI